MKIEIVYGVILCLTFIHVTISLPLQDEVNNEIELKALEFVNSAEEELQKLGTKGSDLAWAYNTNISDYNEEKQNEFKKIFNAIDLKLGKQAKTFDLDKISDEDLKRKLQLLSQIGTSVLEGDDLERYIEVTGKMKKIYSTAKVPDFKNATVLLSLTEIKNKLAESNDPEELEYYWTQWRMETGGKMRQMYLEYIELTNKAAMLNGYVDGTEMKTVNYESETFVEEMADTWEGLKPLYEQLHAYVRYHLNKKYGNEVVDPEGPIPAHILGNMWAQNWNNIVDLIKPYPNKPSVDVTEEMKNQGWTPKYMFEKADEFFQSIGYEPMTETFWNKSMIEKPEGREVVCHASAWDFMRQDDFRIKMCTRVNQEDFITVNHEMGHIQYQMQYQHQPTLFRDGANHGFHEGIADILSLAVGTASYYKRLGLLSDEVDISDKETNINILFNMALAKLVFMPFGYLVDKYRWDLYSGIAKEEDLNCHWAKLRSQIQGVKPPNVRTEDQFDAGSKYHVAGGVGYVRYFTAHIYQFQFYRSLCLVSNQYVPNDPTKPLHHCNFYGSKEAGEKLNSMLKLGSSKPWKEAMAAVTGEPKMDTNAFREYFKPLEDWLIEENQKNGAKVGWINPPIEEMCQASLKAPAMPSAFDDEGKRDPLKAPSMANAFDEEEDPLKAPARPNAFDDEQDEKPLKASAMPNAFDDEKNPLKAPAMPNAFDDEKNPLKAPAMPNAFDDDNQEEDPITAPDLPSAFVE